MSGDKNYQQMIPFTWMDKISFPPFVNPENLEKLSPYQKEVVGQFVRAMDFMARFPEGRELIDKALKQFPNLKISPMPYPGLKAMFNERTQLMLIGDSFDRHTALDVAFHEWFHAADPNSKSLDPQAMSQGERIKLLENPALQYVNAVFNKYFVNPRLSYDYLLKPPKDPYEYTERDIKPEMKDKLFPRTIPAPRNETERTLYTIAYPEFNAEVEAACSKNAATLSEENKSVAASAIFVCPYPPDTSKQRQ